MEDLGFVKMHGLGNDFVIIDGRGRQLSLPPDQVRAIADRRAGVGCDQLILIEASRGAAAQARMRIFNADGHEVGACGNAARCVGWLLMQENKSSQVVIETAAGLLAANAVGDHRVTVDLGPVGCDWRDIPLAGPADTLHLGIAAGPLADPVAVAVGNPHAVFFVDDAEAIALDQVGPRIEHHALFPEGTNVEVVQIVGPDRLRVRVWERGVGLTQACGTGACAATVAAARRGLSGRRVDVKMDGGSLTVAWGDDNHAVLTGPVATSFIGLLQDGVLERAGGHA